MARNFRGLKLSRFSRIRHEPRKFHPRKFCPIFFFFDHTYCTYASSAWCYLSAHDVLSILCSVVVSLWLSTNIFKLRRNLVARGNWITRKRAGTETINALRWADDAYGCINVITKLMKFNFLPFAQPPTRQPSW